MCDRAHCLYPNLFAPYRLLRRVPNSVFHEFVTVSMVDRYQGPPVEPVILLVGSPWFLKGADLLIRAFQRLASEFPEWKLKILGHFPDRAGMEAIIGDAPQIEIMTPRPNPEVLQIISQAQILVLASRCEGMGRVLIEGMGAGIALVGSDVGGIPTMIHDGENGLLFPCGDDQALEQRLRTLMQDPALRKKLGDKGYARAHSELSEASYVERFADMVRDTVNS
jgi:glycosyltransferase involved in cell wall biosynthesis